MPGRGTAAVFMAVHHQLKIYKYYNGDGDDDDGEVTATRNIQKNKKSDQGERSSGRVWQRALQSCPQNPFCTSYFAFSVFPLLRSRCRCCCCCCCRGSGYYFCMVYTIFSVVFCFRHFVVFAPLCFCHSTIFRLRILLFFLLFSFFSSSLLLFISFICHKKSRADV